MNGKILPDDADGIHPVRKKQGCYGGEGDGTAQHPFRPSAGGDDGVNADGSGDEEGKGHGGKRRV